MAANTTRKEGMHALVIGAGATGLLIAHGLKKAGIKVTVFEYEASAQTYRPREWTMGIHWGLPLMESLLPDNLRPRLAKEAYVDPSLDWDAPPCDCMRMIDGTTGKIMKDVPIDPRIVRVSRRKLRAFLAQEIDVEYNSQLVNVKHHSDGSVTAIFASGTETKGSLIVGCDGPRSAVRDFLFGPGKADTEPLDEVVHCNTSICYNDAEKARFIRSVHPVWAMAMHPNVFTFTSIIEVPDPGKPETWRFQVVCGWIGDRNAFPDSASRLAEVKRRGQNICEPFRSAIQWLPDDLPLTFDLISCWPSRPWDSRNGTVTLAGDAAHPMPPHRGQGLNHAVLDAYNLVKILTDHASTTTEDELPISTRIQNYGDEVAKRGAEEIAMSKKNAYMALNWETLQHSPMMQHSLNRSPKENRKNGHSGISNGASSASGTESMTNGKKESETAAVSQVNGETVEVEA